MNAYDSGEIYLLREMCDVARYRAWQQGLQHSHELSVMEAIASWVWYAAVERRHNDERGEAPGTASDDRGTGVLRDADGGVAGAGVGDVTPHCRGGSGLCAPITQHFESDGGYAIKSLCLSCGYTESAHEVIVNGTG